MTEDEKRPPLGWAITELLGHRRLAGYLSERELAGHGFLQLDIPLAADIERYRQNGGGDIGCTTQLIQPGSVYAITPCSKEVALEIALQAPQPVQSWDVRALLPEITETVKREIEQDVRDDYYRRLQNQQRNLRTPADDEGDVDEARESEDYDPYLEAGRTPF